MKPRDFCLILSLLLITAPLSAQDNWYQVEMIVFEYLHPDSDGELWYGDSGLPSTEDSIELIFGSAGKKGLIYDKSLIPDPAQTGVGNRVLPFTPFLVLPKQKYRLQNDFRILQLSSDYRPILHISWQQPSYESGESRSVHIAKLKAGQTRTDKTEEDKEVEVLPPELADNQIHESFVNVPLPLLDGILRLRSDRYLHVDMDFAFSPEMAALQSGKSLTMEQQQLFAQQQAEFVRLKESRKIKLNELHYFDHPLFGVLLQVSRM